eukprot:scaffold469086_cov42-Prasinocladus_malaysianus.AAC.1
MEEEGVPSTALREVSVLQMLNESNHVVKLLSVEHVEENGKPILYLVFEYLTTDLKKFMDRNGKGPAYPLPKHIIKSFMYQLVKGVAHCHKHGVMHRDLKPQNLLVDDSNPDQPVLKIADLGLARAFSIPIKSYTHEIVTLWYRSPEVLLGGTHYSTPVDMWSVGCIFAEMVRKAPLFPGDSEFQQLLHIFKTLGTPSERQWAGVTRFRDWHEYPQWQPQDLAKIFPELEPSGVDLIKQCLQYDNCKRISVSGPTSPSNAKEAMNHPYFDDLDKEAIDAFENTDMLNPTSEIIAVLPVSTPNNSAESQSLADWHAPSLLKGSREGATCWICISFVTATWYIFCREAALGHPRPALVPTLA